MRLSRADLSGAGRVLSAGSWLPWLLLAAAVAEAVLWEGGFAPVPRIVFGAIALSALAASAIVDRRATRRLSRHPVVVALWMLAALGAISAAWTVGSAGDGLRWGLVTAGYGAVAVAAGVAARRRLGIESIAAGICALAVVSGVVGLVAACVTGEPFADRIGGTWRPGGTLEYSSALALLEVTALPALLSAMCSNRTGLRAAGAAGAVIAGAVIGLADSRAELLLAGLVAAAAIVIPERTIRSGRLQAAAASLTVGAAALSAHLIAGGHTSPGTSPGIWRLIGLAGACAIACCLWMVGWRTPGPRARAALACAAAAGCVIALSVGPASGARAVPSHRAHVAAVHPRGDLLHGRGHLWHAALEAFGAHPLLGAGADSFVVASARYQRSGPIRFAHNLPLELGAELGIGGLLLCLWLYAASGAALWRAGDRPAGWLLGPGMFAFLAASLVDWPWHLAGSGAVWAMCAGGVIGAVTFRAWPRASRPSTTTGARTRSRSRSRSRSGWTAIRSR